MKKKVLIIINISKEESKNLADEMAAFLKEKGFTIELFSFDGFNENTTFSDYAFVVTLGGDGTVLFAARNCVENQIPVFPVNLGQFGFMSPIQQNEWKTALLDYLDGKSPFQQRCLIKASVKRNGKELLQGTALNDIVISSKNATDIASLVINFNEALLCKLKSDGVIISTPTGSTAYSASAGGPIVDPLMEAVIMTPMNSFSLSSRPIVLNPKGVLSINIQQSRAKSVCIVIDGQEPYGLLPGDTVEIQLMEKKVQLIGCTEVKFYNSLRSKLNWRGEPYA